MSSLVVVVAEISIEVTLECGVTRHQSASEGRSPALLEDGALDALDGTVGLWSAGANEALLGARAGNRAGEGFGSELAAESSLATRRTKAEQCLVSGLTSLTWTLAQA